MKQLCALWSLFVLQLAVSKTVAVCTRLNDWIEHKRIRVMFPNVMRVVDMADDDSPDTVP